MNTKVFQVIRFWIPGAFLATMFCGLVYLAVQQDIRSHANDPQIQMAEDTAAILVNDGDLQAVLPKTKIDIAKSLAPYLVIYNESGAPVGGSGKLDQKLPTLPKGVFDYTRAHGEDRLTWQPREEVRSAIVLVHYVQQGNAGFVLAGRSLREVEVREDHALLEAAFVWIVSILGTLGIALVRVLMRSKREAGGE